jgi:two-component system, LuxR family, response regulator FixJ
MKTSNEKIFVIDDDESVRRSLPMLLKSMKFEVETFPSSEDFLNREPFEGTGCILLDINLGGKSGLELQEDLVKKQYSLPIIFITGKGGVPESVRALKKGAIDFLQKPFDDNQLLDAVKDAVVKSHEIKKEFDELKNLQKLISKLTERELEVFKYVVTGKLNKQIAQELNIAEHTVKLHRGKITEKLGMKSVAEMVRIAEKAGIKFPSE